LHNLALFWVKNANFFAIFFGKNIFKIITSVPGANPTMTSYIQRQRWKIYNATNSKARFYNKHYFALIWKRSSLLQRC
jgi:hypothetical protein